MRRLVTVTMALFLTACLLIPAVTARQSDVGGDRLEAIDAYVEEQMQISRIPGVAVAVIDDGQVVHTRGFGDAGDGREVTPQTLFPIGSLTKSMTALSIMQLMDNGAIALDAPVQAYLPWFAVADAQASARITVRQLLNQTSGLSRQTGIALVVEQSDASLEETVRSLETAELNRPVGTSYEYSNANYAVLSLVVQEMSGQPFGDYLQDHVFTPLGMDSATTSLEEAQRRGLTEVHRYWFGWPVETELADLPGHEPAFVSVEDMATYLTMYLNQGRHDGVQLLSTAGIRQMLTPATNEATRALLGTEFTFRYGMGWFVGPFGAAEDTVWHLGELPSFNAWMVLMPEQDRAVVVMMNVDSQMPLPWAPEILARIPIGVVNLLEGEAVPYGWSMNEFYMVFDAVVFAVIAIQVAALVRLARRSRARLVNREGGSRPRALTGFVAPLLWEVLLGVGILVSAPLLTGMGWQATFMSVPDLTIVLLVIAVLWLLTAIVRVMHLTRILRLRNQKSHTDATKVRASVATA